MKLRTNIIIIIVKAFVCQVIMKLRTNALSWNPMEAFTLTAANEDGK